jgi:putative transposase
MYLREAYSVSERRACVVLSLHRSSARRQPGGDEKRELVARIHALSERYPRFGYRKIYHLLKAEGWRVSRERVRLIRKQEGLQVVKKPRKRRPLGVSTTAPTRAEHPNHVWSYDFLHDETAMDAG